MIGVAVAVRLRPPVTIPVEYKPNGGPKNGG